MKLSKTFLYNKLVTKVKNIATSGFVLKIKYDADKSYLAKKKKKKKKKKSLTQTKKFLILVDL